MELAILFAIGITCGVLARVVMRALRTAPDVPETQDDFTLSARRWGYLQDRRNQK